MKIISFLFSLLLFLIYLYNSKRKRGNGTTAAKSTIETETEKAPIKDYDFFSDRLNTLHEMRKSAREEEKRAESKLNHILDLNQYGIVVNEKNLKRAERELYIARRKRLAIEKQIYNTEKEGKNKNG